MKKNILLIFICALFLLQHLAFCNGANIHQYKKSETMTFEEFLYSDKNEETMKTLKLNENEDVVFKGKVILTGKNVPLNWDSAYTDDELKILFVAAGVKPKENCDVSDTLKNGTLGCYIYATDKE